MLVELLITLAIPLAAARRGFATGCSRGLDRLDSELLSQVFGDDNPLTLEKIELGRQLFSTRGYQATVRCRAARAIDRDADGRTAGLSRWGWTAGMVVAMPQPGYGRVFLGCRSASLKGQVTR